MSFHLDLVAVNVSGHPQRFDLKAYRRELADLEEVIVVDLTKKANDWRELLHIEAKNAAQQVCELPAGFVFEVHTEIPAPSDGIRWYMPPSLRHHWNFRRLAVDGIERPVVAFLL